MTLALLLLALSVPPVQDEENPDRREAVEELVRELKTSQRKEEYDDQSVRLIEHLAEEYARSGPKDRKAILDVVSGTLERKRVREESEDGHRAYRLHRAAVRALGEMHPAGRDALSDVFEDKAFESNLYVLRPAVRALGAVMDEDTLERPVALLDPRADLDSGVTGQVADVLVGWRERPQEERKTAVEALISLGSAYEEASERGLVEALRFTGYRDHAKDAIHALSGFRAESFEASERWFRKARRDDWPAVPAPEPEPEEKKEGGDGGRAALPGEARSV